MRKTTAILLAAIMLLALAPAAAYASSETFVENKTGGAVGIYEKTTDETPAKELENGGKLAYLATETEGETKWYKTPDGYVKKVAGVELVTVKTAELSASDVYVKYDGKKHAVSAEVVDGEGYQIEFSKDGGKTWLKTAPSLTEPGKVTVKIRALKSGEATLEKTVTLEVTNEIAEDATVTIVNCSESVRVREKASSNSKQIGTAKKGKTFKLLGIEAEGKWYKIRYTDTLDGYVFHQYVRVGTENADPVETGKSGTIVNCRHYVNVREKASSSSTLLGTAKKGEVYEVLGTSGSWVKIKYNGKTGFVYKTYIKVGSEQGGSVVTPIDGKTGTIVNCKEWVNVREKASSKSKLLGTAKKGDTYEVLGTSGSWVKIKYNGKEAFVYKTYVKIDGETASSGKNGTIVNCKEWVNVREKASSKSKLLGTAKKGETFKVLGTSGSWVRIEYNGKSGYVFRKYIKIK